MVPGQSPYQSLIILHAGVGQTKFMYFKIQNSKNIIVCFKGHKSLRGCWAWNKRVLGALQPTVGFVMILPTQPGGALQVSLENKSAEQLDF
jgi:hypothetical protein